MIMKIVVASYIQGFWYTRNNHHPSFHVSHKHKSPYITPYHHYTSKPITLSFSVSAISHRKLTRMGEIIQICKRTVVSSKAVEAGKYFALSAIDGHMEKNHIRVVYYYPAWSETEVGEITERLKHSLSETLAFYPVMTGRLIRDERGKWRVRCNDAGVRMVEARARGSVQQWLSSVDREKELQLVYWEDMFRDPYYWSTFYVQITEFEEGGLAIGLSCTHLLADSTCATSFMKAWADISLPHKITAPPFFHPLPPRRPGNKIPNHLPYLDLINHYKSSILNPITLTKAKYTTLALCFSDQMVRACMAMAQLPGPSPFEALAGLFWVSLSKVKGLRNGLVGMSICLDVREALGLDCGFFGNCMLYNKVNAYAAGDLRDNELTQAVKAVREVVSRMNGEGVMDLIEWLEDNHNDNDMNLMNCGAMMNGRDLVCASMERVDPYLAVFEDGVKPIRVSYYVEPVLGEGQVLILSAPPQEGPLGRVAMVTLPEDEAIKLCEDDLISHLSPNILMKSH